MTLKTILVCLNHTERNAAVLKAASTLARKHDAQFRDVFAAMQDADMALMVHPWEMMGKEYMDKYWLPWLVGMPAETARAAASMIFGGVFERYPNLRVCFAHGGQLAQINLGRRIQGFDGRPDLFEGKVHPRKSVGHKNIFFDTLVHDTGSLKLLIDVDLDMGPIRYASGSHNEGYLGHDNISDEP